MKKLVSTILTVLPVLALSCHKPAAGTDVHEFSLYGPDGRRVTAPIQFGCDCESATLRLYSTDPWTSSSDSWISVSPSGGNAGSSELLVTVAKNESMQERKGTISFSADGKVQTSVIVVQNGATSPLPVFVTKTIAHRGVHNNTAGPYENSLESFILSQQMGVWGSEFDVWATLDSVVVVNHNAKVMSDPREIQNSRYDDIKDLKLGCGEHLPLLTEYLDQGLKNKNVKLVLEVKTHSTTDKNNACIEKCIKEVKARRMEDQMVWIAFSYDNCLKILDILPDAHVQYLNGDRSPASLAPIGFSAIDYSYTVLDKNISWIEEAHEKGMAVNVWTVNSQTEIMKFIDLGVDYITTNAPALCMDLCAR